MPDHRIGYLLHNLVLVGLDVADTAVKLKVMGKPQ